MKQSFFLFSFLLCSCLYPFVNSQDVCPWGSSSGCCFSSSQSTGGKAHEKMGYSSAISGDGNTAIVGAYGVSSAKGGARIFSIFPVLIVLFRLYQKTGTAGIETAARGNSCGKMESLLVVSILITGVFGQPFPTAPAPAEFPDGHNFPQNPGGTLGHANQFSGQHKVSHPPAYIAAVVDYAPISLDSEITLQSEALALMMMNLDKMELFIKEASAEGVQIIVFSEYCLLGNTPLETTPVETSRDSVLPFLQTVPDPSASSSPLNPCENPGAFPNGEVLIRGSCLARKYGVAVVFNMGSVQYCNASGPRCQPDGRNQYNTEVAFDTNGDFIGRYLKNHLYNEPWFNPPYTPQASTFVTSFGVEFGMMICFDLLFEVPSKIYKENGVQNIVYSTQWVNIPPFQIAVEAQQGWNIAYGMNFIAAGFALNGYSSSGSGIYGYKRTSSPTLSHYEYQSAIGNSTMIVGTVFNGQISNGKKWKLPSEDVGAANPDETNQVFPIDVSNIQFKQYGNLICANSSDGINEIPRNQAPICYTIFEADSGTANSVYVNAHNFNCLFSYNVSVNSRTPNRYIAGALNLDGIPGLIAGPVIGCIIQKCDSQGCQFGEKSAVTGPGSIFSKIEVSATFPNNYAVYPWISGPRGQLPTTAEVTYLSSPSSRNKIYLSATYTELEIMSHGLINVHQ